MDIDEIVRGTKYKCENVIITGGELLYSTI